MFVIADDVSDFCELKTKNGSSQNMDSVDITDCYCEKNKGVLIQNIFLLCLVLFKCWLL